MIFYLIFLTHVLINGSTGQLLTSGVSDSEITAIEELHNVCRHKIQTGNVTGQPKANNVEPVVYDPVLQNDVRMAAETCDELEVQKFENPKNYYYEKISNRSVTDPNWDYVVEQWFQEYKNFIFPFSSSDSIHYENIVAAYIQGFACWYSLCVDIPDVSLKKIYVCLYSTQYRYNGAYPYDVDDKCLLKTKPMTLN